jgi:outer membrane protein assembly factor BamB
LLVVVNTGGRAELRQYASTGDPTPRMTATLAAAGVGGFGIVLGKDGASFRSFVHTRSDFHLDAVTASGTIAWSVPLNATDVLVADDDIVYTAGTTDRVIAIRGSDGTTVWEAPLPTAGGSSCTGSEACPPLLALGTDGALYVSARGGGVHRFAP